MEDKDYLKSVKQNCGHDTVAIVSNPHNCSKYFRNKNLTKDSVGFFVKNCNNVAIRNNADDIALTGFPFSKCRNPAPRGRRNPNNERNCRSSHNINTLRALLFPKNCKGSYHIPINTEHINYPTDAENIATKNRYVLTLGSAEPPSSPRPTLVTRGHTGRGKKKSRKRNSRKRTNHKRNRGRTNRK